MKLFIPLVINIIFAISGFSQSPKSSITGKITDENGKPVEGVIVTINNSNLITFTDASGKFAFTDLNAAEYTFTFTFIGYVTQSKTIVLKSGENTLQSTTLKNDTVALEEVVLTGKTESQEIKESGFNVVSIDAQKYENTTSDLNYVLNQTTGIRIREVGGMGSQYNLYLNGLSGRQIRYFLDGIPIDQLGSMYNLNNIPINLVSRMDIYKGVVPVFLGADALGGAINIITEKKSKSFLDASYSYGSFNTHRAALVGKHRFDSSGFTITTMNYYNFSNNSYKMDNMTVFVDRVETSQDIRRFHDDYLSYMTNLEAGFTQKKWADELLLGASLGAIKKDIQNSAYGTPYGEVTSRENNQVYTLKYKKKYLLNNKLDLEAFIQHGRVNSTSIDTTSKRYNWLGEIYKIDLTAFGEQGNEKSVFEYAQNQYLGRFNAVYSLNSNNKININHLTTYSERQGENRINKNNNMTFRSPNTLQSHVSGLSYQFDLFKNKWENTVSVKHFNFIMHTKNAIKYNSTSFELEDVQNQFHKWGYSFSSRYFIIKKLYVKASLEKGYRMPQASEAFGDGITIIPNPFILPESGLNTNLGITYNSHKDRRGIITELSVYSRDMKDFIYFKAGGMYSYYVNEMNVLGRGIELDASYRYDSNLSFNANFTYQQLLNNSKYNPGTKIKSRVFRDQMPNTPYFFTNGQIMYKNLNVTSKILASAYYSINYIHKFYLSYPSTSIRSTKNEIPTQFLNNIGLTLSSTKENYHVSFEVRNLFNKATYDNFNVQKPGRAFFIKLRYYLSKN